MKKILLAFLIFVFISCEEKRDEDLRYKREKVQYIKDLMEIKSNYEQKLFIKELDSIIRSEKQELKDEKP